MAKKTGTFLICLLIAIAANSQVKKIPAAIGYVNDFNHIFSAREIKSLDSLIAAFEKETTVEIALLTIDGSYCTADKFDSLVLATHNQWGVGKKGKNNGVLIGICNEFRKIRISNGYGIVKKLTDAESKRIIDNDIAPEFRKGKFYEGMRKALAAIMKELR
jgi:uncharacterized protein